MNQIVGYRPPRIAMSLVLAAVVAHLSIGLPLHNGVPFAAAIVALLGFTTMLRAWWLFRLAGTAICPTETATSLITHDVFSVSRHPMYLGITLMLAGLALAIGTLPFYIAAITYAIMMDRAFCPYEEDKSLREFGSEYDEYTSRVRRWL
jgi:protein-S-isoprenylcysteine O-methyltransferase Ste14